LIRGLPGAAEVRIIISLVLAIEVIVKVSVMYSAIVACPVLYIFNLRLRAKKRFTGISAAKK
jgi:hypothetical protein